MKHRKLPGSATPLTPGSGNQWERDPSNVMLPSQKVGKQIGKAWGASLCWARDHGPRPPWAWPCTPSAPCCLPGAPQAEGLTAPAQQKPRRPVSGLLAQWPGQAHVAPHPQSRPSAGLPTSPSAVLQSASCPAAQAESPGGSPRVTPLASRGKATRVSRLPGSSLPAGLLRPACHGATHRGPGGLQLHTLSLSQSEARCLMPGAAGASGARPPFQLLCLPESLGLSVPLCLRVTTSVSHLSLKRHLPLDLGPTQDELPKILNVITSAKTPVPNRPTGTGPGVRTWTCLFGATTRPHAVVALQPHGHGTPVSRRHTHTSACSAAARHPREPRPPEPRGRPLPAHPAPDVPPAAGPHQCHRSCTSVSSLLLRDVTCVQV